MGFRTRSQRNFDKYLHEKADSAGSRTAHQLRAGGPDLVRYAGHHHRGESRELVELVHTLQPKCLVDGRIGNDKGDYRSTGDNEIPVKVLDYDWETPVTTNDTWGFKTSDNNWKSARH